MSTSEVLHAVASVLPGSDPAGFVDSVAWHLDQRYLVMLGQQDSLVIALAKATGASEEVVRLTHLTR